MPHPREATAYLDLIEGILEPALDTQGKRITCLTPGDAFSLTKRLQAAVKAIRKRNSEIYPETHPMWGKSDYDKLVIRQRDCVVEVRPARGDNLEERLNVVIEDIIE